MKVKSPEAEGARRRETRLHSQQAALSSSKTVRGRDGGGGGGSSGKMKGSGGRICAVFSDGETDDGDAERCFSELSQVFLA